MTRAAIIILCLAAASCLGETSETPTGAAGSAGAAGSCWVEFSGTWPHPRDQWSMSDDPA